LPDSWRCAVCTQDEKDDYRAAHPKKTAAGKDEATQKRKALDAKIYADCVAAGICPACKKNPRSVESVYCVEDLEKQRQRQRNTAKKKIEEQLQQGAQLVAKRKAASVCLDCGGPELFENDRCRYCQSHWLIREKDLTIYDARKAVGLCQRCDVAVEPGKILCSVCRKKRYKLQDEREAKGLCRTEGCPHKPTDDHRCCDICRAKRRAQSAAWKAAGLCPTCGKPSSGKPGTSCEKHINTSRKSNRRSGIRIKTAVIAAYGGKCQCPGCDEYRPEFLQVDHINNDGGIERRNLYGKQSGQSRRFYRRLRELGFPKDGYQLLCVNCNTSKHQFGRCPHTSDLVAPQYPEDPTPEALEAYKADLVEYLTAVYYEKKACQLAATPA
jgi:hypothetical protein